MTQMVLHDLIAPRRILRGVFLLAITRDPSRRGMLTGSALNGLSVAPDYELAVCFSIMVSEIEPAVAC